MRQTISLRLRTMSVTSSATPLIVENSCATPSMRTDVTAARPTDARSTRASELPKVYPKPRSRGSTVNEPRFSSTDSAVIRGIWKSSIRVLVSCGWCGALRGRRGSETARYGEDSRRPSMASGLLRIQLDDQLLLHRRGDLRALGLAEHLRRQGVVIRLQPRGHLRGQLGLVADHLLGARLHLDGDDVVLAHLVAGDVDAPTVDRPVAVADQLPRLAPRGGEAEAHEHVVEAALEDAQEVLARDAGLPRSLRVVRAELLLEDAVVAAGLLLLAQLDAVLGLLLAPAAVIAGRVGAALDAALVGQAALALEEQLLSLAAALLALWRGVTCHEVFGSDPSPLAWAAAVVCLWSDVAHAGDLEPGGLQRPDRGLAARARALDEDLDLLHALLDALARGGVGRHLRRERRRLARALEARATGRLPGDDIALAVGQGDDGVVERSLDVRLADRDVLLDLATAALWALGSGQLLLPRLLLAGDLHALGALARARVGLGVLAAHGKAATVAHAAVAADLHQALDRLGALAPQIALDGVVAVDQVAQL